MNTTNGTPQIEAAAPTIDLFAGDLRPMQYWATIAEDKVSRWATGIPEGASTGFTTLDPLFRLVDGELTTIAARPSQGKTAFGMQMVDHVARTLTAGCVAVFSAEMTGESLLIRMAAAKSGVNAHKLRMGHGSPAEAAKLMAAIQTLRTLPIWIDDASAPTTATMLTRLAKLNESLPVRMMLFDFMELGGGRDHRQSEEQRISQIALALKDIAKALRIPVIALSQLNRSVETRANKMPTLSDLRYSGQIEAVSDVVSFIMRPEYYIERAQQCDVPKEDHKGIAYLSIAKNRNGPVTNVKLAFHKQHVRFADLVKDTHHA